MDADFWHDRWRQGLIGFHQPEPNKLLKKHWTSICPQTTATVFVPLCGKSHDMTWLAGRGHSVVGVELSEIAARDYFAERGLVPEAREDGSFTILTAGGVEIWVGDIFAFPANRLAHAAAAFDRASLIALPADMRADYARQMSHLMPADAPTLLLTIAYDQNEMQGPPFSVTDHEVFSLYRAYRTVTHLETRDALAGSKNLQERGVTALTTSVFVIGAKLAGSTET